MNLARNVGLSYIEEAHPSLENENFGRAGSPRLSIPESPDDHEMEAASANAGDRLLWTYPPIDIGPILMKHFPEYYWT